MQGVESSGELPACKRTPPRCATVATAPSSIPQSIKPPARDKTAHRGFRFSVGKPLGRGPGSIRGLLRSRAGPNAPWEQCRVVIAAPCGPSGAFAQPPLPSGKGFRNGRYFIIIGSSSFSQLRVRPLGVTAYASRSFGLAALRGVTITRRASSFWLYL